MNNKESMSDNDYLDLVNQLKEINERRDKNEKKMREKLLEYHKHFLSIYGFIRHISDNVNPFQHEDTNDSYFLIDILRNMVSEIVHDEILKFTPVYIDIIANDDDSDDEYMLT